MRRYGLSVPLMLVSGVMLSGCSGFDVFASDTHWFVWNPNRPVGDSENMRRVKGLAADVEPLKPEPGNVWPGPAAPEPTLQDLERQQNQLGQTPGSVPPAGVLTPFTPDHEQPRPIPRGSSTGPGNNQPGLPPAAVTPALPSPPPGIGAGPQGRVYQTPQGPAVGTRTQGNTDIINTPGKNGSIVVPNGNGTSTVIAPDGSISTVPTPK